MSQIAVNLLKEQVGSCRRNFQGTLEGVTNEIAHWKPGGAANPIGAQIAHVILAEDGLINGAMKGGAPLFASSFADKVGISSPPPRTQGDSPFANWHEWANSVEVDLEKLKTYATAVHAATDAYFETLTDTDLAEIVDSPFGPIPRSSFLTGGLILNVNTHCGEISALKGIQGLKGYAY